MATGSPWWRTRSNASTGWSLMWLAPMQAAPGTSACVSTARTPSTARAARVSIPRSRADACGLRSVTPHSMWSARRSDA